MNKAELIEAIADAADLTKADAGRALDGLVNAITGALKKGDTVSLVGFGSFVVKERAARQGRNPQAAEDSRKVLPSASALASVSQQRF